MFGIEESILTLGVVIALCGLVPSGVALALVRAREGRAAGPAGIGDVVGHSGRLVLPPGAGAGRQVRAGAEAWADAAPGARPGFARRRADGDAGGEPRCMAPAHDAGPPCRDARRRTETPEDSHRLAAAAPVDAAAAIAAAGRAGFDAVTDARWGRGGWSLRARDAAGMPVRLRVDGWTGQVVPRPR